MAANFNSNYEQIATNFVKHFYEVFQADRSQLHTVYHPEQALLTFEGSQHQGREAIHTKYTSLPFGVSVIFQKKSLHSPESIFSFVNMCLQFDPK